MIFNNKGKNIRKICKVYMSSAYLRCVPGLKPGF